MPLNSRTNLALATLLAVAFHQGQSARPVGAVALVKRYNLSRRALEPVLQQLVRLNFLHSVRGAAGGYSVPQPQHITVGALVRVLQPAGLPDQPLSPFQPVLAQALQPAFSAMLSALDTITIADLVARARAAAISPVLEPLLDFAI